MAYGDGGAPVTPWPRDNGTGGLDIVMSVSDPRKEVREAIAGTTKRPFREALADGGVEDTRTLEEIGDARRTEGGAYAGAGFGEVRLYGGDGGVLFVVDIPMDDGDGTPETVR